MNEMVKWLCRVFLMAVYFVFSNGKTSQILVTLPENAQGSTRHYLHSHLKTRVKLQITVFSEVTRHTFLQQSFKSKYKMIKKMLSFCPTVGLTV